MNWFSLCLTLVLVQYLVAYVDSASPRLINVGSFNESISSNHSGEEKWSNITETQGKNYLGTKKDKDKDDVIYEPSYFPAYLKPLFQTKSELQIGLHRIEDAEIALEELKDQISQLHHLSNLLGPKYETLTSYIGCGIIDPTSGSLFRSEVTVAYYQNKCYIASDSASSLLNLAAAANYNDARQNCLALGGDLAQPSLQQGSDFGIVIANVFNTTTDTNYWIFGSNIGSSIPVVPAGGQGLQISMTGSGSVITNGVQTPTNDFGSVITNGVQTPINDFGSVITNGVQTPTNDFGSVITNGVQTPTNDFGSVITNGVQTPKDDFGSVITNGVQTPTNTNYWIFGSSIGSSTNDIKTGGGFIIPLKFFRYLQVALFPHIMETIPANYGLALAGPLSAIKHKWYLRVKPIGTVLPYICEFRAIFDPTLAGGNSHFKSTQSHTDYQLPLKSNIETTSDVEFEETLKNAQQIENSPSGKKTVANLDNFETIRLQGHKDNINSRTQIEQTENDKIHDDVTIPVIAEGIANSGIFEGVGTTLELAENVKNIPLTSGNVNNVNNFENYGYVNNKDDLYANQKFEQVKDDQKSKGDFISETDESVSKSEIYGGIRETLVNVDKIENIPLISDYVDNVNNKFENNSSSIIQDNVHSNIKFEDVQKPQDIIVPTNPESVVNSETFIPATIMKQLEHISELRKTYNQKQAVPEKYIPTNAAETKDILPITDQNHPEETVLDNLNEESQLKIEKEKPIDYVTNNSFSQDDIGGAADTPTQRDQYEPKFTGETTFQSNKEVANKNAKTDDLEPRQFDETKKKLLLEDILAKLEQLEQLG